MISATRQKSVEPTNGIDFDTIVTQEEIDAIDRESLTEAESALLDAVQARLDEDESTTVAPPMS